MISLTLDSPEDSDTCRTPVLVSLHSASSFLTNEIATDLLFSVLLVFDEILLPIKCWNLPTRHAIYP